jgi:hypothetical protein
MYEIQIASLTAQVQSMETEASGQIDTEALKAALREFAASSDFDGHFSNIAEIMHLTLTEQRRVIANRQRQLDDDPEDPR